MDPASAAEKTERLRGALAAGLARAERSQHRLDELRGRRAGLCGRLRGRSLAPLAEAARALRESLEEVAAARRKQRELWRRQQDRAHRREEENQRLAETVRELQAEARRQRAAVRCELETGRRLRAQRAELERYLRETETEQLGRGGCIAQRRCHLEELSGAVRDLSLRTQTLRGSSRSLAPRVAEAQQEAELARNAPPGPAGGSGWTVLGAAGGLGLAPRRAGPDPSPGPAIKETGRNVPPRFGIGTPRPSKPREDPRVRAPPPPPTRPHCLPPVEDRTQASSGSSPPLPNHWTPLCPASSEPRRLSLASALLDPPHQERTQVALLATSPTASGPRRPAPPPSLAPPSPPPVMCSLREEVEVGVLDETGGAGASRIREIGLCPTPTMLPLLFMALSLTPAAAGGISCYDDNGQPVDWFVAYKLPHHSPGQGLRYHYLDARRGDWVSGHALINSSQGALGTTLRQLYQAATTQGDAVAYVLYNDQPPRANTSISTRFAASHGHTKGVVLLDGTQGLWLVHSAPHFPPPTATTFAWPPTASRFGQTFLCITFPYASFQDIGQQLRVNQPLVYDSSVGGAFAQDLPDLALAASMKPVKAPPWNRSVTLPSLGGAPFLSLAKHRRFHDDLYSGWLAAALGDTLLVESWRDGPGDLPSNCSGPGPQVLNVAHVAFPDMPAFATTQDHSKWAVADTAAWACVADTNRNRGEEQRGGGAVCLPHRPLWKAFRGLVQDYDPCP